MKTAGQELESLFRLPRVFKVSTFTDLKMPKKVFTYQTAHKYNPNTLDC